MATIRIHRTRLGIAALTVCAVTACGSGGGGGDTEAFCEQVRALDAADDASQSDITAAADQFDALIADAPDEIRDDLRTLVDAFAELDAIEEDDPDGFALLFEIFERPEVVEATETLEAFGVEECGLAPSTDDGVAIDDAADPADPLITDVTDGSDGIADGDVEETTVPGDPYDEEFWGPIDPDELSIPGLKQHLDVDYPDSGWFDGAISGWSVTGLEIGVNADVDPDEAMLICDAILEYAGPISPEIRIRVDDDGSEPLATGSVGDGCAAA